VHATDEVARAHAVLKTQLVPLLVQTELANAPAHKGSVVKAKSSQIFALHLTESIVQPAK
jgi:hypothetical protein